MQNKPLYPPHLSAKPQGGGIIIINIPSHSLHINPEGLALFIEKKKTSHTRYQERCVTFKNNIN